MTTRDELIMPAEIQLQTSAAHHLLFGSMLALLRQGYDSAVITGTLMDCLANLLAQRPSDSRDQDVATVTETLQRRVEDLAQLIQAQPRTH